MPDSFHVLPVVNDTVLDGVLKVQDTSLGLSLITDVGFLVVQGTLKEDIHWHLGSADDGREAASRSIISSDTGLALTGSVIDNNCSLIISHVIANNILSKFYEHETFDIFQNSINIKFDSSSFMGVYFQSF
jgi:hypothetical protein